MIKITFPLARAFFSLLILSTLSACATSGSSKTVAEKQAAVMEMRQDVLTEIYEKKPDVRAQVASSSGYGVFSNVNVNLLIASVGGGYGIVRNNQTGQETYMNMGEIGLGLGAGLKDFRALFVFHTNEALDFFVNRGWSFGAQADAAAKASDKGGAVGGEVLVNNVSIYQLTKSGLALQATIKGAKFWKDKSLNQQQYQQTAPTTTYQQGATSYPQGTTSYPQGTTSYPQGTPYPQAGNSNIKAVPYPNTTTPAPTYQQGPQYLPQQGTQIQSEQYIQQGTEYIQQQGSQLPSSQQIPNGTQTQQQGTQYIDQGREYLNKDTQFEQLGY